MLRKQVGPTNKGDILDKSVIGYVDERELHFTISSPGTVEARGSPGGCQSIFYCRGSPMLTLNVYAAHFICSWNALVRLVFLEGSSLSNPMEPKCIPHKNCTILDAERGRAGICLADPSRCFTALVFHMLGCFMFLFGSGQKKRSCDSKLAW